MDLVEAHHPYFLVAASYALLGIALSALYYFSSKARDEPVVHLLTFPLICLSTGLAVVSTSVELQTSGYYQRGMWGYALLAASLFHTPVIVFLILHYWEVLIARVTSAPRGAGKGKGPRGEKQIWLAIKARLEVLASKPGDVRAREELGNLYATLGHHESAAFEYRKAADWLDKGYAQSYLLYKAAHILIEKKGDVDSAVILLRRIVRLYPKSCFAAYARRILNRHEANASEDQKKPFTPPRSQP